MDCFSANQTTCILPSGIAFLAFTSDVSAEGSGFRATISTQKGVSDLKYDVSHWEAWSGTYSHPLLAPLYGNNERHALIIQDYRLTGKGRLGIEWLSTEDTDFVHFFSIQPFHIDHGKTIYEGR